MTPPKLGDTVVIKYVVRDGNGAVLGGSDRQPPRAVRLGEGALFAAVEDALTGMMPGQSADITIPAAQAFGLRRDDLVVTMPIASVPGGASARPGQSIQGQQPDGTPVRMKIVSIDDANLVADANHPYAGKDLSIHVTLHEVRSSS